MSRETLDPKRTAVLFFDMLNGHVKKDDPKTRERYKPVIAAATELLRGARAHNVMVAYAHANHRADNATSAHQIRDTDNRLNPIPPEQPLLLNQWLLEAHGKRQSLTSWRLVTRTT